MAKYTWERFLFWHACTGDPESPWTACSVCVERMLDCLACLILSLSLSSRPAGVQNQILGVPYRSGTHTHSCSWFGRQFSSTPISRTRLLSFSWFLVSFRVEHHPHHQRAAHIEKMWTRIQTVEPVQQPQPPVRAPPMCRQCSSQSVFASIVGEPCLVTIARKRTGLCSCWSNHHPHHHHRQASVSSSRPTSILASLPCKQQPTPLPFHRHRRVCRCWCLPLMSIVNWWIQETSSPQTRLVGGWARVVVRLSRSSITLGTRVSPTIHPSASLAVSSSLYLCVLFAAAPRSHRRTDHKSKQNWLGLFWWGRACMFSYVWPRPTTINGGGGGHSAAWWLAISHLSICSNPTNQSTILPPRPSDRPNELMV